MLSRNVKVKIYKTIILPDVLYWCETWSLTLREEHRLKVFENSVLRRIFGSKRDEVTRQWMKLHSGSFIICTHNQILLGRSNQIKANEVGGACGMHGRGKKHVQGFSGKPEGKRPLERPRRRWEDGTKMDLS
jgi:hypothetical protein